MKKIISIILLVGLLLAIAGCAATPTTTQSTTTQPTTTQSTTGTTATTAPTEPKTAAFVMIGLNNDFFQALKGACLLYTSPSPRDRG